MAKQYTATRLLKETYQSDSEVIVHRGGARSSKSYSIIQYLIWRMTNEPGCQILVCRKTMPALKLTAYKVFIELLHEYGYYNYCSHSLTNNTLYYKPNNSFVAFVSIDNPERIKSSEWNVIFMEEANEFKYEDYIILKTRLSAATTMQNKLILSLNPVSAFSWIKTEVVDKEGVHEIVSNYEDNPFLSKAYVKSLLQLAKLNDNFYKVFCLGEWGTLDNVIFPRFSEIDNIPDKYTKKDCIYGMDWGFTHPSTLVAAVKDENKLFLKELFYESGYTNAQLIDKYKLLIPDYENARMYGDNAEPARIKEFRNNGFPVRDSKKGKNSVKDSIDFINRHEIFITSDSLNLIKEFRTYSWQTDKDGQLKEDTPVKVMDDAIAAARYAVYSHWGEETDFEVITSGD